MEPTSSMLGEIRATRELQIRTVIEQAPWFEGGRPETLAALLDHATARQLRRGDSLSRSGERIQQLTLIIDGVLEVSFTARSGRRHITGYAVQGELFNLVPFMDGQGAGRDTVALTDTLILQLSRPLVTTLMAEDPALSAGITLLLCQRSRHTYDALTDTALLSLRQRLVRMLLHLGSQVGRPRADGIHLLPKMSQTQLAEYVGGSRTKINQELKQLEQEEIIKVAYSKIVIRDEARLMAIAIDR
ncbi:Crp/Fnr family transcriptional regulator [Dyella halodurans]|uniref:CRP-like protein Clp n=1 Tax=Dyella halodurans TaxID=1920171 RepID=A0ABV9C5E1_9GAMM|nr:Crp/Fnr family transcriptional regulator [Dyella halodurans]